MTRQHYGAVVGVFVGYLLVRLIDQPLVRAIGHLAGHQRGSGVAIGVLLTAIPFAALVGFTVLRLVAPERLLRRPVKVTFVAAWFVAGAVLGLLPWSRVGARLHLAGTEARSAPGLLHGIDLTIVVGMIATVVLLFVALRARHDPPSAPLQWVEHQFEDAPLPGEEARLEDGR